MKEQKGKKKIQQDTQAGFGTSTTYKSIWLNSPDMQPNPSTSMSPWWALFLVYTYTSRATCCLTPLSLSAWTPTCTDFFILLDYPHALYVCHEPCTATVHRHPTLLRTDLFKTVIECTATDHMIFSWCIYTSFHGNLLPLAWIWVVIPHSLFRASLDSGDWGDSL